MPKFSLFRKPKKQPDPEKPAVPPQEESTEEAVAQPQEQKQETVAPPVEQKHQAAETLNKTYLKAMPLKELTDIENIKNEVKNGNIIILRVNPLANKSIDEVKSAVNELYEFTESIGGDIARLGEERVVICPKNIRIWREKTPVSNEPLPTAA
ncbi:MAG: cell division protein SepF [Candidatus Bathyarchaeota archaeon]|nr:cell division protein SepF [Candidatus Bathyarchaeota archaeon]